jgi:hypothetical protein
VTGYAATFRGKLFRYPGAGGWHFVPVPEKHAPLATHAWGRTPVLAVVGGHEWKASVWRDESGRTLLAVPQRVRGAKGDGDMVAVKLTFEGL